MTYKKRDTKQFMNCIFVLPEILSSNAVMRKTSCIEFRVVLAFTGFAFISQNDESIFCTAKFGFGAVVVAALLLTLLGVTCFDAAPWPRTEDRCLVALTDFWLFCDTLLGLSGVVHDELSA